ncbi:MAG TPA: methionine synthase, partial [Blastocatellia bacterium]|nr:methionine synthase [Blastocatellia bacterium]
MKTFLESLKERVIVFDGAMGTSLQARDLTADDFGGKSLEGCNENLVLTRPDVIADVHAAFFEAGADVVETDTFGATSIVLAEYDIADRAYEINVEAARIARRVADQFTTPDRPRWVAGSMGPTTKLPSLGNIGYAEMSASYEEQARGLLDGGVDILLVETCQDLLQTKAALSAVQRATGSTGRRVPVMAQVTIEAVGTMLLGSEIAAALTSLEPFGIDVIGMNCATGPKQMAENVRYLCHAAPIPVSVIPNAGLPENVGGHAVYRETPESFAAELSHFVKDLGVNIVGGCCGTTPAHIKALAEAVGSLAPRERTPEFAPAASSLYIAQPYHQDTSFLIVGERVNASGSRKCRDLLIEADWDGLVSLAREQVREGAHILDVNVDYVGRDGVADMKALVSRLVTNVTIPLMLDSTEWEKMEAGLQHSGGKCILNSTNFEDGEPRFEKVVNLAREYGAAIVIGTIDEEGMARTADKKLEIVRRAVAHATRLGIPAHDIFIDPLALPISTGIEEDRRNAAETIDALRRIENEFPEVNTILGVSNISFGLNPAARVTLNSVFLHEAVEAGLDAAIVNASKILPLNRIAEHQAEVALKLIADARQFDGDVCTYDPLGEFTTMFEGQTLKRDHAVDATLPIEERLKRHVIDGEKIGLEPALTTAMESYSALEIINDILLDGMKTVGDLFGSGQMQLPFVLQSAEVMKAAVKFLEPFMDKVEGSDKGTMVLATVKGDVHDIGKNLVDIILTNNGYRVLNLGIKQPIEAILTAYEEHGADAIGMSGLLVKSTLIMKENLEILNERGITVPVVLGGAALTRRYVEDDLASIYSGPLYYANDAFGGLHIMDRLRQGEPDSRADVEMTELQVRAEEVRRAAKSRARAARAGDGGAVDVAERSAVATDVDIPAAPFYGQRKVENIPLDEIFGFVNESALFKGQWQIRQGPRSVDEFAEL